MFTKRHTEYKIFAKIRWYFFFLYEIGSIGVCYQRINSKHAWSEWMYFFFLFQFFFFSSATFHRFILNQSVDDISGSCKVCITSDWQLYARQIESMKIATANIYIDLNRFFFLDSLSLQIRKSRPNFAIIFCHQILRQYRCCCYFCRRLHRFAWGPPLDLCAVMNLSKTYQTITENYDKRNYIIGLCIMYSFTW